MPLENWYQRALPFVERFDAFVKKRGLPGRAIADHICYKCESGETFDSWRTLFEHTSAYLHQSLISKRRISYIKLQREIPSALGPIRFLELSDQKPDGSQREGFDHIEAYPHGWTYAAMVEKLRESEHVAHIERPHHTTDDIDIGGGFLFRCSAEPLIEKIKREEL